MKSFNGLTMPFLLPELAARGDADDDGVELVKVAMALGTVAPSVFISSAT